MLSHPEVVVAEICEPRGEIRDLFASDFDVPGYRDIDELCADPTIDVVYVASPHQFHRDHAVYAARAGKHLLVEKPMALTLAECDEMIAAADEAGVVLMVGHTNGYDAPILSLREMVKTGQYGRLRMVNTLNFSDFLYRPRRPEELDTSRGGGIMFNQFPHQIEIVRTIVDAQAFSVSAVCGSWDDARPTEGAVSALVRFENGVVANLVYNGYAHLDSKQFFRGLDRVEEDQLKFPARRRALASASREDEIAMRVQSGYPERRAAILAGEDGELEHERFGMLVASFDHADVVQSATGLVCYTDDGLSRVEVPFGRGGRRRATVIDELCGALAGGPAIHDGRWARVTLSICLAALESSTSGREVTLDRY